MSNGAQVDYDALAKQYGAVSSQPPGVDYDALAKQHGATSSTAPPQPGFLKRFGQSLGIPTSWDEAKSAIAPATIGGVPVAPGGSGAAAVINYGKKAYQHGKEFFENPSLENGFRAAHALQPNSESQQAFAQDLVNKNWRGAVGTAAGTGLQAAAPEILERTGPLQAKLGATAGVLADPAIDAVSKLPFLGKVVDAANAIGKYKNVPSQLSDIWGKQFVPDTGAPYPSAPSQELSQATALYRGSRLGVDPASGLGNIPVTPEPPATYPGAPFPISPTTELTQARSLVQGARAYQDPAAGLGEIPVRGTPAPIAAPSVSRTGLGKQLDTQLRQAVGNKPLQPGVSLRNQYVPQPASAAVPAGMTPVEGSSAVKAFRYDPAAQEFHVMSKDGTTYVYGEVNADQFEAFRGADSMGQAWKAIRDNSPLVAKVLPGGKRVAVKPTIRSASPDYEFLNDPAKWNAQGKF